ncbi:MAG: hypothetical protein PHE27_07060 [Alphaproteobacteria bacterium]|nr:hypothetical protein [Alphaproteobacteria bacterium]
MATRDLLRNQLAVQSLAPAARTNGTATGTAVDLRGFDGAVIAFSFGAHTDGTHTPTIVHSDDNETFTTCVYGTDLDGPSALAAVSGGTGSIQQIGYIGNKRYVAAVITTTGATTGALSAATVIAGYPHNAPTM